jgi:hypothetical protein
MGYVLDVAQKTCEMSIVTDYEKDLGGLTPSEWCEIADNVAPFIDALVTPSESELAPNPYKQPEAGK